MNSEVVVNLHVTERCNYRCSFCFGKWGLGSTLPTIFSDVPVATSLLDQIARAVWDQFGQNRGMRFNFVGGEPALLKSLPALVEFSKALGARISYVSNGLMLRRFGLAWTAKNIDIVGLSIDSGSAFTNTRIGRIGKAGPPQNTEFLCSCARELRRRSRILIKVNTVVSAANREEDLSPVIRHLDPDKWKIMRVLPVYGDRDAVTLDEFRAFLDRHQEFASIIVSEDNEDMIASYLMVDPLGRFFWRVRVDGEGYEFSDPILRVGATAALQQCPIAWEKYEKRYDRLAI